ncbi:branched-chain amino acid ABC transporter permease [Azoarcus communis]|uniref:Branched-chain amino acid ABC transporter permease n=1 Tax=Parazoarcus communis SWub3 = DSM 12120 TaxID=1121029 RepID=A0A323UQ58_9RHOO|nr:branched-chain amino acid ABC transporter permease [Parazoarcus communis]NMG48607.1 branched-chain amino acid ABC transporter permease [Parazoarcus communis]NMG72399.1 branched-chain amino acid ABC transporter permease [Parazoarcus communis SWub3 = DSM 12120]PZA14634.1 branched-chain amino acid ABC transporter permease [Azoarcus communis] [Parazoarcus communis SWub3 = DSM 12120]
MLYLILEQALNGLQYGLMLFLLAAGLTLVFGIMDLINLAHGSLYMIGAFLAAAFYQWLGSFFPALFLAIIATALIGVILERLLYRRLQGMSHLSQVLATFALILIANETIKIIFGAQPLMIGMPASLSGPVELVTDELYYPAYRLLIIAVGLVVAVGLYVLVNRTRIGMWMRAGASNPQMAAVMGVRIKPLFTFVFALGAALCALAGALLGPLLAVSVGMGESILIPAFEVIVIGGIGSMRGALVGSLLVGMIDTVGRLLLTFGLKLVVDGSTAATLGPTLASMMVSLLMVAVLFFRPQGLFPARG